MSIRIKRKPNTGLTWEANALFRHAFPKDENIFEIPNINWMVYLHKSFDLIEATDENGKVIDLRSVMSCCKGDIKLEVVSTDPVKTFNNFVDDITPEDDSEVDSDTFTE